MVEETICIGYVFVAFPSLFFLATFTSMILILQIAAIL